jgi:hypothetical protein
VLVKPGALAFLGKVVNAINKSGFTAWAHTLPFLSQPELLSST